VKCQQCGEPATVHQTTLVQNEKREVHLCRACAEAGGILNQKELSLPAILQSLIGQHLAPELDELSRLTCPVCGIRFMEFRAEGRLGCPEDYNTFRGGLEPLLYRVHRGTRHAGKAPKRRSPLIGELALRQALRKAVETEDYAEAARIRDLLRTKEAADEPG
jgi:protein arginine kinase activator